ncbi:hypothetical protein KEU06_17355 [Pseudaminobacter sp. 19-2017]|uniref:Uncharacterized protein n=1 Tax=Pseudaminobacter soli (ex Zhang et al. 2022) TaxID=2831468 RepID=A0A942E4G8_9HYPH|nr:hypothetical protein [Pseudaminobacter soli]MBS3650385.1 hypothetical protein [Pseudaminobacter soli]
MTAIVAAPVRQPSFGAVRLRSSLRQHEPRFFEAGILLALLAAPTLFAAFVDGRSFQGEDNWIKPLKFEVALSVYLLTLAFYARWLPRGTAQRRWYRIYSASVVAAIAFEMVWICGAAALGTASHFNPSPEGEIFYSFAGIGALLLTSATPVYAWLIARNPTTGLAPALKEALVTGLALTLPLTLLTAGMMSQMGAHGVGGSGVAGGTFPVMGWLRDGGDLRVAHFFATHAMHFIPAFGLASVALWGPAVRLPVRLFALGYIAFVVWVFAEALAGRAFLPGVG